MAKRKKVGKDTKHDKGAKHLKGTKHLKGANQARDAKPDRSAKKAAKLEKAAELEKAVKLKQAPKPKKSGAVDPFDRAAAVTKQLAVGPQFVLADLDPASTPGFTGDRDQAEAELAGTVPLLADLQERLWAGSRAGDRRSVLVVLQGMDTSGKGGIVRHVLGAVDPQGVALRAFKKPTAEELAHDFLWRIRRALPASGEIGVFDRSHYEDVLVVRVHDLVPRATWSRRYATINRFEASLAAKGTTLVKVFLHLSAEEQRNRLAERLERPDKHWKYNPGDVDERAFWADYQEAYQVALTRCSPAEAPWYVVPADHKWYARWAVQHLLLNALHGLDLKWPPADFDVDAEKARLAAS